MLKKIITYLKPYKKNIINPLIKIVAIIIISALLIHFLEGKETLAEYAKENPEIAYKTND